MRARAEADAGSVTRDPVVQKTYSCDKTQISQATNALHDRFVAVVHAVPSNAQEASAATPYRIEAPRACDGIGRAIADAFDRDQGLPQDMAVLLAKLNNRDPRCIW